MNRNEVNLLFFSLLLKAWTVAVSTLLSLGRLYCEDAKEHAKISKGKVLLLLLRLLTIFFKTVNLVFVSLIVWLLLFVFRLSLACLCARCDIDSLCC